MTKIIDLTKEAKELKPIEFIIYISPDGSHDIAVDKPSEYKFIELNCRKYGGLYDLMFAFNTDKSSGSIYLGHFNDGIV